MNKKIFERIKSLNRNQHILISILSLIVLLTIFLRSYHIDYPTIGYHNMKEDEFLSFALNMYESGDYLRTTWYDCSVSTNDYYGYPYTGCNFNEGETPLPIWLLILFFLIFGWKLWVARLFIIIFAVGTVIVLYLLVKKLTKNNYIAILSSFFYSILPLSIFFGRNIQMDSPSLFLALCSLLLFINWIEDRKFSTFFYACLFIVLTSWFKITSLIVLSPLLFLFPYADFFKKKYLKEHLVLFSSVFISLIWMIFIASALMPTTNVQSMSSGNFIGKNNWVDLSFSIFSSEYWQNYGPILKSYINDNYSFLGLWLIILGLFLFLLNFNSKISKFMMGYFLGIILYIILFAYKWNAHNYYQFPFLPFAAVCLANTFFQMSAFIGLFVDSKKYLKILKYTPLILILFLITPFTDSTMRQFNTQFFGQDVAGNFINSNTEKNDIILLERGIQNQISWTARRFYYSVPENSSKLIELEENLGLEYIVLTYSGINSVQNKPSWDYIKNNYHIVQIGFILIDNKPQIYHIILKKGGFIDFNLSLNGMIKAQTYEISNNKIDYYVINVS